MRPTVNNPAGIPAGKSRNPLVQSNQVPTFVPVEMESTKKSENQCAWPLTGFPMIPKLGDSRLLEIWRVPDRSRMAFCCLRSDIKTILSR